MLRFGLLAVMALLTSMPARAAGGDASHGGQLFNAQCQLCHNADGNGGQGPALGGVVGRKAGNTSFGYTQALRNARLAWNEATLDRFLANPQALVPGTAMAVRVPRETDRRDLIAYLASLKTTAPNALVQDMATAPRAAPRAGTTLTGPAAFGDWRSDAPGVRRRITVADLPAPFATESAGNSPRVVARPSGAKPKAPDGFNVELLAEGLRNPRVLRVAPNGDIFVAETAGGRISVLRNGKREVFAEGLDEPFGISFFPPGPNPKFVYVAENNAIKRFAYTEGDLHTRGAPETIVPRLTTSAGGHSTRDIAFSPDGSKMYVSLGSQSNVAQGIGARSGAALQDWVRTHALGAAWGAEENRASVLVFSPDGKQAQMFATGLRNCVGLAVQPTNGVLWCSTNERDGLGDDLVPDYITTVREGAFYGWPWYYLGDHEDPRLRGQRPDLRGTVTVPDVLLQAHSASLGITYYGGSAFPPAYRGLFASEHGSWNRSKRTGYKVVRVVLDAQGAPTGEYEDFLTGFVVNDSAVWGRPVGVAVDRDGALLVSEDASGTIWRVSWEQ
jgi:glucose/arabinose dehydrogenase/cytochrome c2